MGINVYDALNDEVIFHAFNLRPEIILINYFAISSCRLYIALKSSYQKHLISISSVKSFPYSDSLVTFWFLFENKCDDYWNDIAN